MDYERKIKELERSGDPDAASRIEYLRNFQKSEEQRKADELRLKTERAEKRFKGDLKRAYLEQPNATEADFEREYPRLRSEHLNREALQQSASAKAVMSRNYRIF